MGIIGGPPIGGVGSIPGRGGPAFITNSKRLCQITVSKHFVAVIFCHTHTCTPALQLLFFMVHFVGVVLSDLQQKKSSKAGFICCPS